MNSVLLTAAAVVVAVLIVIGFVFLIYVSMSGRFSNLARWRIGIIGGFALFVFINLLAMLGYVLRELTFPPAL